MAVKARVSQVKVVPSGARVSYVLRYETDHETRIATVPIGYADGVVHLPGSAHEQMGEVLPDQQGQAPVLGPDQSVDRQPEHRGMGEA